MRRIGVLGGSFNPVHWGHLHIALLAREAAELDRVLFVPAASPPHKPVVELAPAPDRRAMLELALRGEPASELCDVELDPGGTRFTVDTLARIALDHPGSVVRFILGMDSLAELSGWREPERIVQEFRVIAVNRPGLGQGEIDPRWRGKVTLVEGNPFALSSSAIRARVAGGRSIRHLVPEKVRGYIEEHGLYRPGT